MEKDLREAALEYHRWPTPGKISVRPTKGLTNQRDLALAYSPGVAAACDAIVEDPATAAEYTSRANLVGVVTNGTAVLGLGNIGPLAAKPVMEGKGCLFKKFAGIDVFDIELAENDPDKLIDMIAAMEPTLGGVNLEDIKAPECFYIEQKLKERMNIPVFHDDQHGTAIISAAAMLNGLLLAATQAVIDATGVQIVSRDFVCSYDYYPQTRPAFGGLAPLNSVPAPWLSFGVYPVTALASVTVGTDLLPPTDYEYDAARLGFASLVNGRVALALTAGAPTEWGKAAALAVAAYMYEHRGGCDAGDAVKQSSAWALIKGQRRFAGGL